MNKSYYIKIILLLPIFLAFIYLMLSSNVGNNKSKVLFSNFGKVFAEDDGDDDERQRDYDKDDVIYEAKAVDQNVTNVPAVDTPPAVLIRYITIIDPGFNVDTDGDGLVNAIDPNPTIPEKDFFTDDDGDGIPNASDAKKGENDFLYITFEDVNQNGILDSLEAK